ncbi:hypothetical protein [Arthrobacter sulfonylureivorans]|uniref:Uncharacterized protein n=1 Tax=Arthrobacter sulfonylureivorans TaxID=2486855 RepID=A0ABY3WAR6_9MICC|nr:hypothetical protein [Arthrobacter sulfonylureivorans]UNK47106.1 hypothetical protein MNQ99_07120 [Arthrobacter sulfonylureivorans]
MRAEPIGHILTGRILSLAAVQHRLATDVDEVLEVGGENRLASQPIHSQVCSTIEKTLIGRPSPART